MNAKTIRSLLLEKLHQAIVASDFTGPLHTGLADQVDRAATLLNLLDRPQRLEGEVLDYIQDIGHGEAAEVTGEIKGVVQVSFTVLNECHIGVIQHALTAHHEGFLTCPRVGIFKVRIVGSMVSPIKAGGVVRLRLEVWACDALMRDLEASIGPDKSAHSLAHLQTPAVGSVDVDVESIEIAKALAPLWLCMSDGQSFIRPRPGESLDAYLQRVRKFVQKSPG